MLAGIISPEASATPVARPFSTTIDSTSSLQRSWPPWLSIKLTRPLTSAPVPPMAKWTPQRFSRNEIRQ